MSSLIGAYANVMNVNKASKTPIRCNSGHNSGKPVGTERRKPQGITPDETGALEAMLLASMDDVGTVLAIDLTRDQETVRERVDKEGFGFISKVLPTFLDWFRSCIESNSFQPCSGFKTARTRSGLLPYPAFLQGLVSNFVAEDGSVLLASTPEQREIQRESFIAIEMFCTSFGYKYEVPLNAEQLDGQLRETIRFDEEDTFKKTDVRGLSQMAKMVLLRARDLVSEACKPYTSYGVIDVANPETGLHTGMWGSQLNVLDLSRGKPKHGSGAVAVPLLPHEKYIVQPATPINFTLYGDDAEIYNPHASVHPKVGAGDFIRCGGNSRRGGSPGQLIQYGLEVGGISRLSIVPKNSRKGRVICCEPVQYQFVQQGIRIDLVSWLERNPVTGGYINFASQRVNQDLALDASRNGFRGTLDVTNASQSITSTHVSLVVEHEGLREALFTSRTRYMLASLKGYERGRKASEVVAVFEPQVFAPMGSATCFPVEALVFWALAKATVEVASRSRDTQVWVYGDDLILPSDCCDLVIEMLKQFKIKVNGAKSFYKGQFRESCGADCFDGLLVSPPARCSTRLPISLPDTSPATRAKSMTAWVEYANIFQRAGLPSVAKEIKRRVGEFFPSSRSYPILNWPNFEHKGFFYWYDPAAPDYPQCSRADKRRPYVTFGRELPLPDIGEQLVWPFQQIDPGDYQGSVLKVWAAEATPYRADITDDDRYYRSVLGYGGELPGNYFVKRDAFRLRRKVVILT